LQPEGVATTAAGPGPSLSHAAGEDRATSTVGPGPSPSPTAGEGETTAVAGPEAPPSHATGEGAATTVAGPTPLRAPQKLKAHHATGWSMPAATSTSRTKASTTAAGLDLPSHLPLAKALRQPHWDQNQLFRMLLARAPRLAWLLRGAMAPRPP
jgi:hypothetical protein